MFVEAMRLADVDPEYMIAFGVLLTTAVQFMLPSALYCQLYDGFIALVTTEKVALE